MSEILEQLKHLSRYDLLVIYREVSMLLEDEKDPWEMSPEQETEMKRRLEDAKRDNYAGESWAAVKAQLLSQAAQHEAVTAS